MERRPEAWRVDARQPAAAEEGSREEEVSLREIGKFPVEPLGLINPVNISIDGDLITVGFGDNDMPPRYGLAWFDLRTPDVVTTLVAPAGNGMQNIDGWIHLLARTPEFLALLEAEGDRSAICLLDRQRNVWQRVDGERLIIGSSAGSSHLVHMKSDASALEVIHLGDGFPWQMFPHKQVLNASVVAVNEALTHRLEPERGGPASVGWWNGTLRDS